jgi:hypothetical protein
MEEKWLAIASGIMKEEEEVGMSSAVHWICMHHRDSCK